MPDLLDRPRVDRPRIDPRIAQRWIDARRQEGRRRLRIVVAVITVVVLAAGAVASLYSPLFEVHHVRVTVEGPVAPRAVAQLTGLTSRPPMIDVHTGAIATRLDADPWLGSARVDLHWPDTVTVRVVVRSPVALVAARSGWAQVDATGRVLAVSHQPTPGLPVVEGLGTAPTAGQWLTGSAGASARPGSADQAGADMSASSDSADVPRGAAAVLGLLDALPPAVRSKVTTVSSGPGPVLSLVAAAPQASGGTVSVSLGDGSELGAKASALVTMLTRADLSGATGVDLSVPGRPAVTGAG